jgi:hypothetical protein
MDRFPFPEFVGSLLRNFVMSSSFLAKEGYVIAYADTVGMQRHTARNDLVGEFLKLSKDPNDCILFLDSDMAFPKGFIEQLIRHNKPVVGGFYVKRLNPGFPLVLDYSHQSDDGEPMFVPNLSLEQPFLVKCDATGMGCLLIQKRVFTHLKYPYFHHNPPFHNASEEMAFFWQLYNKGIPCFVDTGLDCGHAYINFYGYQMFDKLREKGVAGRPLKQEGAQSAAQGKEEKEKVEVVGG